MKTALVSILTTASLTSIAAAGEKGEMIWDKDYLASVANHPLAREYADPQFPPIDTLDPGGDCKDISAKKTFNMPLYEQTAAGIPFTAGIAGELALTADANEIGVRGSLGPSIDVFGEVRTPLDLTLSASTNSGGVHSIDLSVTAFGFTILTENLASSSASLSYADSFGWSLPNLFTARFGDSYFDDELTSRIRNASFDWTINAAARAQVGGIVIFSAGHQGVQARALVTGDAYAALNASATFHAEVDPPDFRDDWYPVALDVSTGGHLDLIRYAFGGRGLLVSQGAHWLAEGAASLSLDDTMGAYAGFAFTVPILDEHIEIPFFGLQATAWNDDWKYSCTFDKQFR